MKLLKKKIVITTRIYLDETSYKSVPNGNRIHALENILDVVWVVLGSGVWHPVYMDMMYETT